MPAHRVDPFKRFVAKLHLNVETGCWEWTGGSTDLGYGRFRAGPGRKQWGPHRWSYEHFVGPIPDGLVIDHLCSNPPCCNPEHLEPVTQRENLLRAPTTFQARNAAKTHCPQGHEYTEENTYLYRGGRACRICNVEKSRRYELHRPPRTK